MSASEPPRVARVGAEDVVPRVGGECATFTTNVRRKSRAGGVDAHGRARHHVATLTGRNAMASLSRTLAKWIVGLRYEDLPPEVVDRAKGVTLHCISSMLLGSQTGAAKQAAKLITDEEDGVRNGATLVVDGRKVTRGGAA